jgi:hypothetical protein
MPRQSGTISLSDTRNAQCKVGVNFPGLEQVSEEIPQMGGERFVAQRRFAGRQMLQEGSNVRRSDLRQITVFLTKMEGKKTVSKAPAMENRSLAQAALAAQIFFVSDFELFTLGVGGYRFEWTFPNTQCNEELDEAPDDEASVFGSAWRKVRVRNQVHGGLFVEMLQADAALCHLTAERREALIVLVDRL